MDHYSRYEEDRIHECPRTGSLTGLTMGVGGTLFIFHFQEGSLTRVEYDILGENNKSIFFIEILGNS